MGCHTQKIMHRFQLRARIPVKMQAMNQGNETFLIWWSFWYVYMHLCVCIYVYVFSRRNVLDKEFFPPSTWLHPTHPLASGEEIYLSRWDVLCQANLGFEKSFSPSSLSTLLSHSFLFSPCTLHPIIYGKESPCLLPVPVLGRSSTLTSSCVCHHNTQ